MGSDLREFCLRWNNHHNTLVSVLDSLLERERLVDVTLAAEGQFINVHRIVLFACSPYFEDLLSQLPDKQAVVFLKDVQFSDLKALVDYMYKGEVNVSQERLGFFLQTAEALKIKGLVDKQQHKKITASLPENILSPKTRARMNGPKVLQKLPQQYSTHDIESHPPLSLTEDDPSSPVVHITEGSLTEEHEEQQEGEEETEEQDQEQEQIEDGVMVAEMEPDDTFVSLEPPEQGIESDFGDDHFEATENWSSQDPDDDYWDNSNDFLNSSLSTDVKMKNPSGSESWAIPQTDDSAGPSRPRRNKRKSQSTTSPTQNVAAPTARGYRRRVRPKIDIENDDGEQKYLQGDGATVDEAGVTTCSCGRTYTKRKNYVRHIKFECGQEPRFACEFKDCTSRFKRKDNLKGHVDRVHLSCTS